MLSDYLPLMALMALVLVCLLAFRCLCFIWRSGDVGPRASASVYKRPQLPFFAHRLLLFCLTCQGAILLLMLWGLAFASLQEMEASAWQGGGALFAVLVVGWVYAWRRGGLSWK